MRNKLALYIHLPFCVRKCLYCDFCSKGGAAQEEMHAYTDALLAEISYRASEARGYTVDTVFFGGGTPTLLPLSDMRRITEKIHACFSVEGGAEITAEANPATADEEKLRALRALGINRLSIGVQSLDDGELASLGRVHNAQDAIRLFRAARTAGFDNLNIDLMYGIPNQTEQSLQKTLDGVLSLSPEHISAYSLIVEEGTPFYEKRDTLPLPDEDTESRLHDLLSARLRESGYAHYEISNYAKEGYACRHNLHYWRAEPYLGFGAAAYSCFDGARYGNTGDITAYIKAPTQAVAEKEVLKPSDRAYEYIMLAFRLSEGLDLDVYKARFGVIVEEKYAHLIERFSRMGLMERRNNRLCLTEKGMRFSNTVLVAFMEEDF